ncbi:hypothetical protein [Rhodoplanes serenus]|uniref:hypothetical protein n=2 Tax=Rhodoplanes TaxID=29407 RepID=UPI00101DC923|nr:hypothetical protein [Rhodoplanes serenus]
MSSEELITRLEQARGPSRDLDEAIKMAHAAFLISGGAKRDEVIAAVGGGLSDDPRPYTFSVDHATTLVPSGWVWKVGTCCVSDDAWVVPDWNSPVHGARLRRELGEPASGSIWDSGIDVDLRPSGRPAIALCIAALKAHQAMRA